MKSFVLLIFAASIGIALPAAAQRPCEIEGREPCDLNNNGIIDVSDGARIIGYINHFYLPPDSAGGYWPLADCDCDSVHLTLSDMMGLYLRLIHGIDWGHGELVISQADTLSMPSLSATPGQVLDIPIFLSTSLSLNGIQFFVSYNPDIISISGFSWNDTSGNPEYPYFTGNGYANYRYFYTPVIFNNPVGFLRAEVRNDITPPVETYLEFTDDPIRALYTGFSRYDSTIPPPDPQLFFIRPVKIAGRISVTPTGVADESKEFLLAPELKIWANPGNASYLIAFYIPTESDIDLTIFNILGQNVANLARGFYPIGRYEVVWNAESLSSGVYFCRLLTGNDALSAKIMLLK